MSVPFYDRVSPRCGACKTRKPASFFSKWCGDRFWEQRPFCVACEPCTGRPENPAKGERQRELSYHAQRNPNLRPAHELVPMATCPGCERFLKLQAFRKWWGSKRMHRTLCITCEPERKLVDMTPAERERLLVNAANSLLSRPGLTPQRVASLNEKTLAEQRQRRSTGAKRRHSAERTIAWAPTLRILRDEKSWCERNLITPASPQWRTFFESYAAALKDALHRAKAKKSQATSVSVVPSPQSFLYYETLQALRRIYADCPVIRGRRLYRDPLCLEWEKERHDEHRP